MSPLTKRNLRAVYDMMASLKKLSPRTKNLRLTYLKVVLKWAVEHPGIALDEDPTQGLKRFKTEGSSSEDDDQVKPDEVFSLEEVQKLLAYAREKMSAANAAMLETAFATGLRRG